MHWKIWTPIVTVCVATQALFLSASALTCRAVFSSSPQEQRLTELLQRNEKSQYGPNCFGVALYARYSGMKLRYASEPEMKFYLNRDFTKVTQYDLSSGKLPLPEDLRRGDILVFDDYDHVATYWEGGLVVDTRGPDYHYNFRLIDLRLAHQGISAPPGTPIDERGQYREASPFRKLEVYRAKVGADFDRTLVRPPLEDLLVSELKRAVTSSTDSPVVNKAILDTIQGLLNKGVSTEAQLELQAMNEWYDGFFQRHFYSSPHATEESVLKRIAGRYLPTTEDPLLKVLVNEIWMRYGNPKVKDGPARLLKSLELKIADVKEITQIRFVRFDLIEMTESLLRNLQ